MERRLLVSLVLVAICGLPTGKCERPVYCPSGWVRYGASCYMLKTEPSPYTEAEKICEGHGGYLVEIHSEGEQEFQNTLLRESGFRFAWIGLSDTAVEGTFTWKSVGTVLDTEEHYTNWADKQPNDFLQSDCVVMKGTSAETEEEFGQWNDVRCSISTGYVCQKPINPCPEGWDSEGDFCYKVMTDELTFDEAATSCESHNAMLSSIHSQEEQNYHTAAAANSGMRLWIGMTDIEEEDTFRYIDGTPVGYTNWASDQPDNHKGTEHCVHLYIRDDTRDEPGKWNDNECDKTYGFICKKTKAPCPVGWLVRDRFCYFVDTQEKTYNEADDRCADMSSTLTTITSADEQVFHTAAQKTASMPLWIGLNDIEEEGNMVWVDGTQVTFTNWDGRQPDDFQSNEDCVQMRFPFGAGLWKDDRCEEKGVGFMCKMPMVDSSETVDKPQVLPVIAVEEIDTRYCPEGWTRYGGFCYILNMAIQVSQAEADTMCLLDNAKLTSIHSEGEQRFHEYLLRDFSGTGKGIWIGLNDEETEGEFVYTNSYEFDYTNWSEDEPNSYNGNEDCVEMLTTTNEFGQWNDQDCSAMDGFICRKPVTSCPNGWESNGESCYFVNEVKVTYDQAEATCQGMNSILTSVKTQEEQTYLTGVVTKVGDRLWIGLDDRESEGIMQFLDGSPLTMADYTNWGDFQPDALVPKEDCVYMRATSEPGQWTDDLCSATAGFICKKPKGPCPPGFQPRGIYCYRVMTEPASYEEAVTSCESMGTTLTMIRSADEQTFHTDAVSKAKIDLWIGLDDQAEEGTFIWADGTQLTGHDAYTNWANNQPDNFYDNEDCAHIKIETGFVGKWNDRPCTDAIGYMCMATMIDIGNRDTDLTDLQCLNCIYEENNGIVQPFSDNREACVAGLTSLNSVSCSATSDGSGDKHRCYTHLYQMVTETGDIVNGVKRGCAAIDDLSIYSTISSTSNTDDIKTILSSVSLPNTRELGKIDLCDTNNCNEGYSSAAPQLQCYTCRYHETNGKPDDKAGDKEACYSGIGLELTSCIESGPLTDGDIYRCYTSPYEKTTAKGDIVAGIRRGCVAVDEVRYGDVPSISDMEVIQDIFDFTLMEGDTQLGTATFCSSSACNIEDITITECDFCALMDPCPEWTTCINQDKTNGWTCNAPVNQCPAPIVDNFSVRLVDGPTENEGVVEIYKDGAWSKVCDGDFDITEARVICSQMGFPYVDQTTFDYSVEIVPGSLMFTGVTCTDNENKIEGCLLAETSFGPCMPATVVKCLPEPSNIEVRLADGNTPEQGRVEVRYNEGDWSTVCNDNFDINDAHVVCNMLGYTEASEIVDDIFRFPSGQDTMPILLDEVKCTGSETNILECSHGGLGVHDCSHHEDIAVVCKTPEQGDIRLVDSVNTNEGRVEILQDGEFATICNMYFDILDANVICKQLGYPFAESFSTGTYGPSNGNIWPRAPECVRTETRLSDCPTLEHEEQGIICDHSMDVGVVCFTEEPEIRLVGGTTPNEGRVEILYNGEWGTVCDDIWNIDTATVACKSLGYIAATEALSGASFGQGTGPILLDDVSCLGNEDNLLACAHTTLNTSNCAHYEDASVVCKTTDPGDLRLAPWGTDGEASRLEVYGDDIFGWGTVCDDGWFAKNSLVACRQLGYKYVNRSFTMSTGIHEDDITVTILLDNVDCTGTEELLVDCQHNPIAEHNCGHDEDIGLKCLTDDIEIHLVGGSVPSEGRVEITYRGERGTVCDDLWGLTDAKVLCKSLGYTDALEAPGSAHFGEGEGSIFLDDVECTGSEESVFECEHLGFGLNNCGHDEDASVICVAPSEGSIRLSPVDNRLEIYHDNVFGTICDDSWNFASSVVACRQMNFTYVNQSKTVSLVFADESTTPIWLDEVVCTGTENTLADCPRNEWGDHNCGHSEDITVTCLDAKDSQLRLSGGDTPNEGIVELYYEGKWGTICDDSFDNDDASVVCRQLGYSGVVSYSSTTYEESSAFWLDEMTCNGDENNVLECQHSGLGVHDCSSYETVRVTCFTEGGDNECYSDPKALDYRGIVAITDTGKTCQKWTEQVPHEHDRTPENYPGFGLGDHNYCRNPDNEPEGAWCYTTEEGSRFEYCNIGSPRDCGTTTDEEGSIRISSQGGRLEIFHDNEWGTVCDDLWSQQDSIVACKQLGFRFVNKSFTAPFIELEEVQIWMDDVECVGTEETLVDCDRTPWGETDCTAREHIAVECMPDGEFEIRLVDGIIAPTEGRVEININGEWGTMCDDEFDDNDAAVVCRQLGFPDFISWRTAEADGEVLTSPVWLDNIACIGTEDHILDCQHNGLRESNCGHDEDVFVKCRPDPSEQTPEGSVRFLDGGNDEGRVEIYYKGEWGTICDDGWDFADALVVCKELGFPGAKEASPGSTFPAGTGSILLDSVSCKGTESKLVNCTHSGWNNHNCGHYEDAGVRCFAVEEEPPRLRLIAANGNEGTNEGRVEVYYDGRWGTVCDDDWSIESGNVVCKQLGFENGAVSVSTSAVHGEGTGDILMDNVRCTGSESALGYCLHNGFGNTNCGHQEDAGVVCHLGTTGADDIQVQLVGGASPLEGRVEITTDEFGIGTVCDDSWGIKDATVVCRMLGYSGAKAALAGSFYGEGNGTILLDDVACVGTEDSIANCMHRGYGVSDCDHSEDAGVECFAESELPLPVRLREGWSPDNGRVEVYVDGQWGTVCDDLFGKADADVICKTLGYKDAVEVLTVPSFPAGSEEMPIVFDDVECLGDEAGIEFCNHANVGVENCGHSEDIGVRCRAWEDGDLRLVKGSVKNEGRLEVYYQGLWGQICDDLFTIREANVACYQLGFDGATSISTDNNFGNVDLTDIFLDNVSCGGEETKLVNCQNLGWRQHNCQLSEAIEITCNPFEIITL